MDSFELSAVLITGGVVLVAILVVLFGPRMGGGRSQGPGPSDYGGGSADGDD